MDHGEYNGNANGQRENIKRLVPRFSILCPFPSKPFD
jgi:hypothetical protein